MHSLSARIMQAYAGAGVETVVNMITQTQETDFQSLTKTLPNQTGRILMSYLQHTHTHVCFTQPKSETTKLQDLNV